VPSLLNLVNLKSCRKNFFEEGTSTSTFFLSLKNIQKFESIDLQLTHISNLFFLIRIGLDLESDGAVDPYPDPGRPKLTHKKVQDAFMEA
jgi:hypothetical protein